VPSNAGTIVVYAPYANGTNSGSAFATSQYVDTNIRFSAIADGISPLVIAQRTSSGTETLASLNVTSSLQDYAITTELASGLNGNMFFFVENANATVYISNITFSRAG
jgi:hypothetical protein